MTIGIYRLTFIGTTKVYVGMSKDINKRYSQHIDSLKTGTASKKMLEAYKTYGFPNIEILCECSEKELCVLENEAIEIFDSVENGFNTVSVSNGRVHTLEGEDAPNAIYSKDVYISILKLLATTNMCVNSISEMLGVSYNVVAQIKQLVNHSWLEKECPEYYNTVKAKLLTYKKNGRTIQSMGKEVYVISPSEEIILVTSIALLCKQYNLDSGNMSKLINGKLQYYLGWRLLDTPKKVPITFLDPNGKIHELHDTSISEFSKQHGLDNSCMSKVAKGKSTHHKGWVLYNV